MATIRELAEKGQSKMRRPCWVGKTYIKVELTEDGLLPERGTLFSYEESSFRVDPIALSPFIDFDDFEIVKPKKRRRKLV